MGIIDLGAIASEATLQRIAAALEEMARNGTAFPSDEYVDATFAALLDDTNTTGVFGKWWALNSKSAATKYARLERFFNMCAMNNNQQHTVQFYAAEASSNSQGTPLDWLADKEAAPLATASSIPAAGWDAENRMTWYVRANALSLADGTMNVLFVEGESGFDITGEIAPVYTFQLAPWFKETVTEEYETRSWRATRAAGYAPYAWDVAPDGTKRAMTWHPTFGGGLTGDGKLTSGAGRRAATVQSATGGLTKARQWDAYEGLWADCDTKWLLYEWQHRHWHKENSGILEGCTSYYYSYQCAVAETDAERVILTTAQAANLLVGSTVSVGDTERATANVRAKILSIQTVTIDGTEYAAVWLDSVVTTTTATYVSTVPWDTGATEVLPDHMDGAPVSLTGSKNPIRIAGVETLTGCYEIGLDPLYQVTANEDGTFNYAVFECRDSEKLAGSIGSGYQDTGIGISNLSSGWHYVKAFVETPLGILFPRLLGGSSSGYYRSAFYCADSAGVRCPWRFGFLNYGSIAGLAYENGNVAPSNAYWHGAPRLAGSGKKRGEWAAS